MADHRAERGRQNHLAAGAGSMTAAKAAPGNGAVGVRPLYARIRDLLADRIRTRVWHPGQLIPNEFEIAAELGVSQGTVRKALNQLAEEQLVMRRQGRGTFVMEHTPEHVLFRFFNIVDAEGQRVVPETANGNARAGRANRAEAARLAIATGNEVVRIDRVRTIAGTPIIRERVVLPGEVFPGILDDLPLPNTLYDYFQRAYAITIADGDEQLSPLAADAADAKALGVDIGTPLLCADRVMRAIDGRTVEWRVSRCRLDGMSYRVRLA